MVQQPVRDINRRSRMTAVAFEALEARLRSLGIEPTGDAFEPITPDVWQPIEAAARGRFPDVLRWLFERFGAFQFEHAVVYDTPRHRENLFGCFMSGREIADAYEDTRESIRDTLVPIADDSSGNYLCVDLSTGAIEYWIHDALLDRNVEPIAANAEAFFVSLYKVD
jgi:hypothetical protein